MILERGGTAEPMASMGEKLSKKQRSELKKAERRREQRAAAAEATKATEATDPAVWISGVCVGYGCGSLAY